MGPQHDRAVTLAPGDYWRLRFLAADAELARVQGQLTLVRAEARLRAAWPAEADPAAPYAWDDATCSLRPATVTPGEHA